MCPFKPLSELVLKCDTGINLSESCCGGVEPPLMEIFGRVAISSQAPRRVMAEPDSEAHGGFWDMGEDVWRVQACTRLGLACTYCTEFLMLQRGKCGLHHNIWMGIIFVI